MELKDFVAESLIQIMDGVLLAQRHAGAVGAFINPRDASWSDARTPVPGQSRMVHLPGDNPYYFEIQTVEFDVAVTAIEGSEKKGGIGVLFSAVTIGGSRGSTTSDQSVTRVKFSIPLALPHHPDIQNQPTPAPRA